MNPVTDPSMQGLGNSPTFLVEGSWVVGFFRDANEKQQPIVIGSLPGVPSSTVDETKGFNDPKGIYPNTKIPQSGHSTGESDTNRLARGGEDSETHQSLIDRRAERIKAEESEGYARSSATGVPIATKPNFGEDGVSTTFIYEDERKYWDEPHPQGVETSTSEYPHNHVFESESGHITEIDDTLGNERLHREHRTGTFEEIHADGTRDTKVVKDDYEIVYDNKNVFVSGNVNLTIGGNVNHLIQGDYVQEVEGNYTLKVGGGMFTKIGAIDGGNYELDVLGGHSFRIADNVTGVVGIGDGSDKNYDIQIHGDESRQVAGVSRTSVVGNATYISDASLTLLGKTNLSLSQTNLLGTFNMDALGKLNTRITGTVTETYNAGQTTTIAIGNQTTSILVGNQTTTTLLGVINLN